MRILIVIDDFFNQSNGMCISTQRFAHEFKQYGHEVKVVSCPINGSPDYSVPELKIPLFQKIIIKEGYHLAWPKNKVLKKALSWADIVAIETPFPLGWHCAKLAKRAQVPCYGTFHIFPGNITETLHLNYKFINSLIMYFFRYISFYNCLALQCPTSKVKQELLKYNFRQQLYVISNGISNDFIFNPHKKIVGHPFTILCIGRFSREKHQITLFKALKKTKYATNVKVIFAGQGPLKTQYKKLATSLPCRPILRFYSPAALRKVMVHADLVIHCADVEVEGMAPMEAFASGCVPIIANSPLSATAAYALSPANLFPAKNSTILAHRIDYWYTHPVELKQMKRRYRQYAKTLTIEHSASKALKMMQDLTDLYN